MRVGVAFYHQSPMAGGGYTFQSSLLEAIRTTSTQHHFVLLNFGKGVHEPDAPVPWINLDIQYGQPAPSSSYGFKQKLKNYWARNKPGGWLGKGLSKLIHLVRIVYRSIPRQTPVKAPDSIPVLDRAAHDFDLDLIWFLTPFYEKVSIPFMITVWDLEHRLQPYFPEVSVTGHDWDSRESFYRSVLPRAARVITGTHTGKNEIVHFYRVYPENVAVIPFSVPHFVSHTDSESEDICRKYNLDKEFLFYPAQFWPHKNHYNILLALNNLKNQYFLKLQMVFVGSDKGNESYIRQTVEALELEDQVRFLGFIPMEDVIDLYKNALALVFASFFGPDNLPPLEAFMMGCPVIAAKVTGAEEQLGDAALLFNPKNPNELVGLIKKVHSNSAIRQDLVRKGRERVSGRSSRNYLMDVCHLLDDFESIRRCWGRDYQHT